MKHYIIERLSWDTTGKEKETWKQCNKRDVEELTFVVEDLKEVSLSSSKYSSMYCLFPVLIRITFMNTWVFVLAFRLIIFFLEVI